MKSITGRRRHGDAFRYCHGSRRGRRHRADVAYPGTLKLAVDATDLDRRIFRVRETIPVAAGPLTLLYPQWLPGNHAPRGPIDKFAGLLDHAPTARPVAVDARSGRRLRLPSSTCPPARRRSSPNSSSCRRTDASQGRVVMTPEMLNPQWNTVALYPAGYFTPPHPDRAERQAARRAGSSAPRWRSPATQPATAASRSSRSASRRWSIRRCSPAAISSASISIPARSRRCASTSSPTSRSDLDATPEQIAAAPRAGARRPTSCSARATTTTTTSCSR